MLHARKQRLSLDTAALGYEVWRMLASGIPDTCLGRSASHCLSLGARKEPEPQNVEGAVASEPRFIGGIDRSNTRGGSQGGIYVS